MIAWLLLALIPTLTPGVVRPLSLTTICQTKWSVDRRHVTTAMRREVARRYHMPLAHLKYYELDHLIPRSLGGADDALNLWPEDWPDARRKDRLEIALHRAVCAGRLDLLTAQTQMRQWGS